MVGDRGHLLVGDDSRVNRMRLSRGLEQQGYSVALAEDGQQALHMLTDEPFDLVLLDILMPEMDGFEVLEHMKQDDLLRNIPVIMISAMDEFEGVVRCIELGDAVNLAARLEQLNKAYGSSILVSESTTKVTGDQFPYEAIGTITVPGKKEPVGLFKLSAQSPSIQ